MTALSLGALQVEIDRVRTPKLSKTEAAEKMGAVFDRWPDTEMSDAAIGMWVAGFQTMDADRCARTLDGLWDRPLMPSWETVGAAYAGVCSADGVAALERLKAGEAS